VAKYTHTIDAKGRIFLPSKLRGELGSPVFITHSLDEGYLAGYAAKQFQSIREQISALSGTDRLVREMRREIIGEAMACDVDGQGRISLSDELWSHIGVKPGDEIYIIYMFDKLEICSKSFYGQERITGGQPLTSQDLTRYDVKGL
jgi:MraZ protein